MRFINKVQLTYIPSDYWNESIGGFELLSKGRRLPKTSSFFLLWIPSGRTENEDELSEQIKQIFPTIPSKKLLTCKINLAIPLKIENEKNKIFYDKYFEVANHLGKIMPISPAIKLLYQLDMAKSTIRGIKDYSNSIKTWAFLTKLVFELLNKGQFIPILDNTDENKYTGQWRILLKSKNEKNRFDTILRNSTWPAFCLPLNFFSEKGKIKTNGLWHPRYVFSIFMDNIGDTLIRSILIKNKFQTFNEYYSTEINNEANNETRLGWDYKFLKALTSVNPLFTVEEFYETILPTQIRNWAQSARGFTLKHGFMLNLELEYPEKPEDDWPLKFSILSHDGSKIFPINDLLRKDNEKENKILKFFQNDRQYLETILRALGAASKIFPPIKRVFSSQIRNSIKLTSSEVIDFLKYPKDLLIQSGFSIVLPDVFTMHGKQRLYIRLKIHSNKNKEKNQGVSSVLPSLFDIKSMVVSKWEVKIGDQMLTENEFNDLLSSKEPLINFRGKWIMLERQLIEDLIITKSSKKLGFMEAIKFGLTGKIQLEDNGNEYDVVVEGDFNEMITNLQKIDSFEEIPCPRSFNGKLRHYQDVGLTWMGNMTKYNFGLCLADDMGLGKTIQIIAFLLYLKEKFPNNPGSVLIICPTSVLFNWHRELNKFAPDLEIVLHHGAKRVKDASKIPEFLKPHRIYLTSYGTIRNDINFLETINFSGVIIDESQNMKNYASKQTKAINRLKSQFRICLSGTPIENRLLELWSLFNFLNPGLLGSRKEFQEKYSLPIERFQNKDAIKNLQLIISPFILRRIKTDKKVINDLPKKNEIKLYLELNEKQIKLYQELVENTLRDIDQPSVDKKRKRGLILGLLVKLKQICNHPYQYLKIKLSQIKKEEELKEIISLSPKMERLLEMTEEVISNGEKVLIFTQFTQMGTILHKTLEFKHKSKVLYLHGGVPEKKRRVIVDEFQSEDKTSPSILILSLKAGGTGLNLTQGTTVIHFDRWWNPAVEDQATDRAYRIGQKSVVNVFKFIMHGTIEEKIDILLEEKRELANKIVLSTGESWISDLNTEKLKELLLLNN